MSNTTGQSIKIQTARCRHHSFVKIITGEQTQMSLMWLLVKQTHVKSPNYPFAKAIELCLVMYSIYLIF